VPCVVEPRTAIDVDAAAKFGRALAAIEQSPARAGWSPGRQLAADACADVVTLTVAPFTPAARRAAGPADFR
jgi:hypothetical protein